MSAEAAPHVRTCAPLPSSCVAVFVEIAGDNRVLYSSTIDLGVFINHTDRFERVFAHARAYTTARPHDRTTARPHDRTTARQHHDHELSRRLRRLAGAFGIEMAVRNGKRNANANARSRSSQLCPSPLPAARGLHRG